MMNRKCNVIGWSSMDMDIKHNVDRLSVWLSDCDITTRSDKNQYTYTLYIVRIGYGGNVHC